VQDGSDVVFGKVDVIAEYQSRSLTCRHAVEDVPQFARVVDARRGKAGTVATLDHPAPVIGPTRIHDRHTQISLDVIWSRLPGAESDKNVLD
jgi:hypothetical protein